MESDPRPRFAALVRAEEAERRRVAGEIHDDPVQAIVAAGMRLQLMAAKLPGDQGAEAGRLGEDLAETVRRLRLLVARLRAPALDGTDLAGSLTAYLEGVVAGWGIVHSLRFEFVREIPEDVVVTIFRIAQEALANVHDHARATVVSVSVTDDSGGILTSVSDDGIGIDAADSPASAREDSGIAVMRARAEAAGGWLSVHGEAGEGVTVQFWLPVPEFPSVPPNQALGQGVPGA